MRIRFIVDGQTEYHCLLELLKDSGSPHILIGPPVYCDMQPYGSVKQIAYRVVKKLPIVMAKKPDLVVVTIDLEDRPDCPPDFARAVELEIGKRLSSRSFKYSVVVKVKCLENWLLGDIQSIRGLSGFTISRRAVRLVMPNKADNVDAINLLKKMSGGGYDKVSDGKKIALRADCQVIGSHSRSFRRFLRVIEVPQYKDQSKDP